MKLWKRFAVAGILTGVLCFGADADEIRVLSSVGIRGAIEHLVPQFEQLTSHKVVVEFGTASSLKKKIAETPDIFDVAILTPGITAELVTSGHADASSIANLGKSGVGLAVRTGGKKPDISSPGNLFGVLTLASSIAYAKDGASGVHFMNVLRDSGIQIAPNKLMGVTGQSPLELVANGKAELGVQLISEIKSHPGVDLVGPFPTELQNYTTMTVSIAASPLRRDPAQEFVKYLLSPTGLKVIEESGFQTERK
jgi:molybdate transport system substrate-binding protein